VILLNENENIKDERVDNSVLFCFILNNLGELPESVIGEIILYVAPMKYFGVMSDIQFMLKKGLICSKHDEKRNEPVYHLLHEGESLANDMSSTLSSGLKYDTLSYGKKLLEKNDRERSVRCDIKHDPEKDRYDLIVKFLNEINGETMLEIRLYAPDEKKALEMQERFLSKPTFIITRTMNMFLKDDFFMYD
jgi:hypothetical protein